VRRASVEKGIGCAAVIPAALIGFAGLTDGIGPKGWFGFSELIGWAVLCAAASFALAFILSRVRWSRIATYVAVPIAAVLAAGFAVLMNWLGSTRR
jgi:hypothetical protein